MTHERVKINLRAETYGRFGCHFTSAQTLEHFKSLHAYPSLVLCLFFFENFFFTLLILAKGRANLKDHPGFFMQNRWIISKPFLSSFFLVMSILVCLPVMINVPNNPAYDTNALVR